jgi:FkbM family methyltransferase
VIAIEPDSHNQRVLTRRFLRDPFRKRSVTIVGKAVSEASEVATMWIHLPGSGLNTLSKKWVQMLGSDHTRFGNTVDFAGRQPVETTTLEVLIESYGIPHYIKIDVEGYEMCVLRGLKRPVPFLSFEAALPEFLAEGIECVRKLSDLDGNGQFNWTADCQGDFALPEWISAAEFTSVLRECKEKSVEVFWRTKPLPPPSTRTAPVD